MFGQFSRGTLIRFGLATAVGLAGLLLFLEYHILVHLRDGEVEEMWREIVVVMGLATFLVAGLLIFGFRRLTDQRRELEARLAAEKVARRALEQALLDPLTGLANRRHFDEIFRAVADKGPVPTHALMLVDLDDFKLVNDTFGHPAGDHVLCIVSARLRHATKESDLVARLGGDEFAVVTFHVASDAEAKSLTQRLKKAVEEPIGFEGSELRVGASIGFTLFPEDGVPAEVIFQRADAALYAEKANKHRR